MATAQKEALRPLTPAERAALEQVRRATSGRVARVRRATALLALAAGASFAAAARQAGYRGGSAVTALVRRFNRRGRAALASAAGRGRQPTYDPAARAHIVATAQREPERQADGTATWSLSTLEGALRRAGHPRLGATTIRRVLRDAGSSYQQPRPWCPTGTAERKRKGGVARVVDPQTAVQRG